MVVFFMWMVMNCKKGRTRPYLYLIFFRRHRPTSSQYCRGLFVVKIVNLSIVVYTTIIDRCSGRRDDIFNGIVIENLVVFRRRRRPLFFALNIVRLSFALYDEGRPAGVFHQLHRDLVTLELQFLDCHFMTNPPRSTPCVW